MADAAAPLLDRLLLNGESIVSMRYHLGQIVHHTVMLWKAAGNLPRQVQSHLANQVFKILHNVVAKLEGQQGRVEDSEFGDGTEASPYQMPLGPIELGGYSEDEMRHSMNDRYYDVDVGMPAQSEAAMHFENPSTLQDSALNEQIVGEWAPEFVSYENAPGQVPAAGESDSSYNSIDDLVNSLLEGEVGATDALADGLAAEGTHSTDFWAACSDSLAHDEHSDGLGAATDQGGGYEPGSYGESGFGDGAGASGDSDAVGGDGGGDGDGAGGDGDGGGGDGDGGGGDGGGAGGGW